MSLSKPILLVGEARGQNEDRIGSSFCGGSGVELLKMLDSASVIALTDTDRSLISKYFSTGRPDHVDQVWSLHPEVRRSNVFNLHPYGDDLRNLCGDREEAIAGWPKLGTIGWIKSRYASELDRLGDEILELDPNLIISLGNTPLWALTGRTGISKLRGTTCLSTHCVSDYKLLCTYHPAAVMRQWELRPTTIIDLHKALRENEFPEVRRPSVEIWIEPSLEDIERFIATYINITPRPLVASDVETSGTRVTCISLAPRRDVVIVIPFDDPRRPDRSYWPTAADERRAWELIRGVLEDPTVPMLFQNGLYDIAFLWRSYGIKTYAAKEDTMLLSHALQPEALKGLGFLGSIFTDHGPWKTERKGNETIGRDK